VEDQGLIPGRGKDFFFATMPRPPLGPTPPPIKWVLETLFLKVKQLEHEAEHPPPTSNEVKNMWNYTSTPL
jgi:hypothetical protein